MDIRIYNFEFELLGILPAEKCSSIIYKPEFNGIGSFEIHHCFEKVARLIENNADTLFLEYEGFQGYVTGYQYKDSVQTIYGKSLNGLLHKCVIPTFSETGNPEELAKNAVRSNCSFLTVSETSVGATDEITFEKENYTSAEVFISDLLELCGLGYKISADKKHKQFVFEVLPSAEINLMLSENNLNAYEFETVYDNKEQAYGGWYKEKVEEPAEGEEKYTWKYITTDSKEGIYREDVVLRSTTEAEALQELQNKKATYKVNCSTKRIQYGVDYHLGDIIKVQQKNRTVKKRVVSVTVSQEAYRKETPVFSEV